MQTWPPFFFDTQIIEAIPRTSGLNILMSFISQLGSENFFIPLLAILWWAGKYKMVFRLHTSFFFSYFINQSLKASLALPRPSLGALSPEVQSLALRHLETTGGLPSGHAQSAIAFYLLLAFLVKAKWLKALLVTLAMLLPLSRLYLGVHYPGDILVGLVLGLTISLVAWYYGERYLRLHSQAPLVMNLLWFTLITTIAGWYSEKELFVAGGALLGYLTFAPLVGKEYHWQDSPQDYWQSKPVLFVLFTIVCLALLFGLRWLLKLVLPTWPLSDMVRYFLLLVFAGYLIPRWQKNNW